MKFVRTWNFFKLWCRTRRVFREKRIKQKFPNPPKNITHKLGETRHNRRRTLKYFILDLCVTCAWTYLKFDNESEPFLIYTLPILITIVCSWAGDKSARKLNIRLNSANRYSMRLDKETSTQSQAVDIFSPVSLITCRATANNEQWVDITESRAQQLRDSRVILAVLIMWMSALWWK